jgi:hypothetical protein
MLLDVFNEKSVNMRIYQYVFKHDKYEKFLINLATKLPVSKSSNPLLDPERRKRQRENND